MFRCTVTMVKLSNMAFLKVKNVSIYTSKNNFKILLFNNWWSAEKSADLQLLINIYGWMHQGNTESHKAE